ncbi:hypothetical protein CS022_24000 [Veronia nyctiphanis]|uniref:NAD-dependent epimerase/dehydratase domain-containing protein n=1 Tax=Veronia nyctiphanis TaxID=1278244 RepID=A0A4Q0YF37_9GAMM|nr:NAD-dependent epimerase/dehydratase family protein [Veronia nyctiphanis]RXJ68803.1 hypothetical protein CS022_24000 [Veronia nyctiphanis]
MSPHNTVLVLGGNGHLGQAVIRQLISQSIHVISVSRSATQVVKGIDYIQGDLSQVEFVKSLRHKANVVIHCASPAYSHWKTQFLPMTDAIIQGFEHSETKLIYADNLYAYGQHSHALTETDAYLTTSTKGKIRAKAAQRLLDAHHKQMLTVSIARGSDFYGPNIKHALLGEGVFGAAVAEKSATYVGNLSARHSFTFIDDFARALILLALDHEREGEVWHVPNAPAISPREILHKVYQQVGAPLKITNVQGAIETGLSWIMPSLRAIQETRYQRDFDFVVNDRKFCRHFSFTPTSLDEGIAQTLAGWKLSPFTVAA